jgi:hypothetical protein
MIKLQSRSSTSGASALNDEALSSHPCKASTLSSEEDEEDEDSQRLAEITAPKGSATETCAIQTIKLIN